MIKEIKTTEELDEIFIQTGSCIDPNLKPIRDNRLAKLDLENKISQYIYYSIDNVIGYVRTIKQDKKIFIEYIKHRPYNFKDENAKKTTPEEMQKVFQEIKRYYENKSDHIFLKKSAYQTLTKSKLELAKTNQIEFKSNAKYLTHIYNEVTYEFIDLKEIFN